ncbi:MAG: HypC/HybG/HupF family hydrogenase formation chaperone [Micromonosporaceae bacterium]|nr:HypC/HybG/HupF family hydrogenase formation chaperone [Micromonosporaceae bacterium]
MCIAEPGVVLSVADGMARVSIRGLVRDVPLTIVDALGVVVSPGDIVLVHTGLAVAVLTPEEAAERVSFLQQGAVP